MTPLKSLMAGALMALSLTAVPASAADWRALESDGQTYYVDGAALSGLTVGHPGIPVFQSRMGSYTPVTGAVLKLKARRVPEVPGYVLARGRVETAAKLVSLADFVQRPFGAARLPSTFAAGAPSATRTRRTPAPAADVPQGVDADVWALVQDQAGLSAEAKLEAARALQAVKSDASSDDFTRLSGLPAPARARVIAGLGFGTGAAGDVRARLREGIAAAAAPGADPSRTGAPSGTTAVPDAEGDAVEQALADAQAKGPIELLNAALATPAGRADIEARLTRYVMRSEKPFIDPRYAATPQAQAAKLDERFKALAKSWIDAKIAAKTPNVVSMLHFVMGFDQEVPAWAKPHPPLVAMAGAEHPYPADLERGMVGWTTNVAAQDAAGRVAPGAYAGAPVDVAAWSLAFFEAAAEKAASAYNDPRHIERLLASIRGAASEDEDAVPPGASSLAAGPSMGWGVKDMFEDGAVVGNLVVNRGGGYRRVSLKIYSTREEPSGKMIDEVGIFDISEPGGPRTTSNIFGRRFPLTTKGDVVFRLDDTTANSLRYKLTIQDGKITFGTPDGSSKIETSQQELFDRRETQARASRATREINGQTFKVIPQAGAAGTLLYYPVDAAGKIVGDGRTPSHSAFVNTLGDDGFNERLAPPETSIGFVGAPKEDKSNFYYLKWNEDLKYFEPVSCKAINQPCGYAPPTRPAQVAQAPAPTTQTTAGGPAAGGPTAPPANNTGEQPAVHDALSECGVRGFGPTMMRHTDPIAGQTEKAWTMFLTTTRGNGFQLCVNGGAEQSVFFQGIPVWGKTRVEGENFITETVLPKSGMIPAEEVICGNVRGASYEVPGGRPAPCDSTRPAYDLSTRYVHYIGLDKISPQAISATNNATVYASKAGWLSLLVDAAAPATVKTMQVRIKDTKVDDALARIDRAFAIGDLSKTGFGDEASVAQIKSYVREHLDDHDAENMRLVEEPTIEINLYVLKESVDSSQQPAVVAKIWAAGEKQGVDRDGNDIVAPKIYQELVYCYQTGADGKLRGLETRRQHNAHISSAATGSR